VEHDRADLEATLASLRPEPDDAFVAALESKLLGDPRTRRNRRWGYAIAAASSLAAVLVLLLLAGANPFVSDSPSNASEICTATIVPDEVRQPRVVTGPDGTPHVVEQRGQGRRTITVCREADGQAPDRASGATTGK
jgi:hypothetical protein